MKQKTTWPRRLMMIEETRRSLSRNWRKGRRGAFAFPGMRRQNSGNRLISLISGMGLGALLMYLFDSRLGNGRRAMVRDQATHLAHKTEDALEKTAQWQTGEEVRETFPSGL